MKALPNTHPCTGCGVQVPYHGRRDLLSLLAQLAGELERGFESSSRLADVSMGVAITMRTTLAHNRQLCATCARSEMGAVQP